MKIIKNELEYKSALFRAEEIIDIDPEINTELADELELITLLINAYEKALYSVDLPDPIDAIKFRMEQQGLKNVDMIQYFGSKSKISEVLNGKRTLSLAMIRKLNKELGIPAEVLISDFEKKIPDEVTGLDWNLFPLAEMINKGWIQVDGSLQKAKENTEELIRDFFEGASFNIQGDNVFFRKSLRSDSTIDEYALSVWYAKVLIEEKNNITERKYNKTVINEDIFNELKLLSLFEAGPLLSRELLLKFGIKLIIVPHLKGTHIDGAAFFNRELEPIIALTLRYDRIDYFWFTLFHELAHIVLHLNDENAYFFDDLKSHIDISKIEKEADELAENELINKEEWEGFYSSGIDEDDIRQFAGKCRMSPAIVAGRVQKETKDYRQFRNMLGQNKVKKLFVIGLY
ncbi:MAG: ImmA/IrrE family metallo-endopeptidase [Spirochaetales bacterium]|nr:ImmA/IrrE family metallo-endopeptidase [Spirochaetales bacterium]